MIESDKSEDFADVHLVECIKEMDIFDELGVTMIFSMQVPEKEPRYLKNSNLCELLQIPLPSQLEEVSGETEQGGVNTTLESTTFELCIESPMNSQQTTQVLEG